MIQAKATMYKSVLFRSKLEACWAHLFDQIGMPWEYEPVQMQGWIPDFRARRQPPEDGMTWTKHTDLRLLFGARAGVSLARMAAAFEVEPEAVSERLRELCDGEPNRDALNAAIRRRAMPRRDLCPSPREGGDGDEAGRPLRAIPAPNYPLTSGPASGPLMASDDHPCAAGSASQQRVAAPEVNVAEVASGALNSRLSVSLIAEAQALLADTDPKRLLGLAVFAATIDGDGGIDVASFVPVRPDYADFLAEVLEQAADDLMGVDDDDDEPQEAATMPRLN